MIDGQAPDDTLMPPAPPAREISSAHKPARCVLFLDNQRLTRDCLTEVITEQCPDLHVRGLRALDLEGQRPGADVALIILNLHDAPPQRGHATGPAQPGPWGSSPPPCHHQQR